ncbi:MAG: hypothetical protein IH855_01015 [Bacteroidetes bacterium]|nr:hypothetical protein [Bacteroidota bacterium]
MSSSRLSVVIVASTAGSVMNEVLKNDFFRGLVQAVVVDRECPALEKAQAHGLRTESFIEDDNGRFCDRLLGFLRAEEIDYVFSYYTRFYTKRLRDAYQDRIVNFHPSLLPAFKGMDGFGDNVAYHARFVGNTVEFIDQAMDEGKIIMQTACPLDTNVPLHEVRHRLFVQQCKALLQVARWLSEGRISVDGRKVMIANATFDEGLFSPALDFIDAIELAPAIPSLEAFST